MELSRAVKGVQDILPGDVLIWQHIEETAKSLFGSFGYQEIRPPMMEYTQVFTRSIGEATDIVDKEMYTFDDKGGRSVTLRPEGTAGIVRAYVQNGLHTLPSPQKLYYMGAMFRYERPQKGRQRQFHQIGAEAFGSAEPRMDAEAISMLMEFLDRVGLGRLGCEINSLGCPDCRPSYREALMDYLSSRVSGLCEDCQRRLDKNPLRILDCKAQGCIQERKGAPAVTGYLCDPCSGHFEELQRLLAALGVPYRINPEMVRGLDYYTRTIFEVTSTDLGAQNAVAAGGRYDRLVKEFGGPDTPAIGFAIGMERLVALLRDKGHSPHPHVPDLYIASMGPEASAKAMSLASLLRRKGYWVEASYSEGSLKSQMRRADRLHARIIFIMGEDELREGVVSYKRFSDGLSGKAPISEAEGLIKP